VFILLARFDQMAYRFRYNSSLRPALARAVGFFVARPEATFENLLQCKFCDPGMIEFAAFPYRLAPPGGIGNRGFGGRNNTLQST